MPKKPAQESLKALTRTELTEIFQEFIQHIDKRFDQMATKDDLRVVRTDLAAVKEQLDRVEFKVTGLSGRVDVLEDIVRVIRTKLALK